MKKVRAVNVGLEFILDGLYSWTVPNYDNLQAVVWSIVVIDRNLLKLIHTLASRFFPDFRVGSITKVVQIWVSKKPLSDLQDLSEATCITSKCNGYQNLYLKKCKEYTPLSRLTARIDDFAVVAKREGGMCKYSCLSLLLLVILICSPLGAVV